MKKKDTMPKATAKYNFNPNPKTDYNWEALGVKLLIITGALAAFIALVGIVITLKGTPSQALDFNKQEHQVTKTNPSTVFSMANEGKDRWNQ